MNYKINIGANRLTFGASLDSYPTPPWATRALIEKVLKPRKQVYSMPVHEPCCGAGHMAKVLKEYYDEVIPSDIHNYGYGAVRDYKTVNPNVVQVITNPPFNIAEEVVRHFLAANNASLVAILVRAAFIESKGRQRLFDEFPLTYYCPFTERVTIAKERLSNKGSSNVHYCWMVWHTDGEGGGIRGCEVQNEKLVRIGICKTDLERPGDYVEALSSQTSANRL